jgi:anti-sigma factor RsiW
MKWFLNRCGRYHQSICLLAGGALSEPERSRVENHLAACADCRKYYDETRKVAAPLADWEENFRHIEPDQIIRMRWAKAIEATAEPASVRRPIPITAIFEWGHDMIWPCRRIWAGLAVAWVLILAANVSLREQSPAIVKSGPPSEMMMTFKDQQQILVELLTDRSAPHDAEPQKIFSPKPRTESAEILMG